MTVDSTDRYNNNIAELRKSQPDVADLVDAATISENIEKAAGRDGSETFLITDETGKKHWLGYSSSPTFSTEEIFRSFRYEGGNVALPGVQTGLEPIVLLNKLPKYAALFVMEENPVHLKLVFQLYDFAQLLFSGRLVIFLEDHFESEMRTFFQAHPGYEFPRRMVKVPQCPPVTFAQWQRCLETSGQKVMAIHTKCMNESLQRIREQRTDSTSNQLCVAIISSDVRQQTNQFVGRLRRTLDRMGWENQSCIPDQPDRCHLATRLQTMEQVSANWVLSIQAGAESLRSLLPGDLLITNWVLPDATMTPQVAEDCTASGVVLIASSDQYDILSDAGIPSTQLIRCEVAADDTVFYPLESLDPSEPTATLDAAIVINLPNDDAQACGIHLNSHVKLWNTMREITIREADRYETDVAEDIFNRAQQQCGTKIDDPKIRNHFLMLLRLQLAPSVIARMTADAMVQAGYQVGVWGNFWSKDQTSTWIAGGDIPIEHELNQLFHSAKVLVIPDHSASSLQLALDAMCAGVHVIYRSTEQSWRDQYPDLSSALTYIHSYRTMNDLTKKIRLLVSTNKYQDQLVQAREAILKEHTLSHRLQMINDRLRRGINSTKANRSSAQQVESV